MGEVPLDEDSQEGVKLPVSNYKYSGHKLILLVAVSLKLSPHV